MTKVLRLTTSILGVNSVSSGLMDELLEKLGAAVADISVRERDFNREPVPHVDAAWLQALQTPADERSEEQQRKVEFSDQLIQELVEADVLVVGMPMYNFTVPSMLNAWNNHVARAGVTFKYTESGPQGLLRDKKIFLVASMGGIHEQPESGDYLRPYMQQFFSFLGLYDVTVITAAGVNLGETARAEALVAARAEIETAVAQFLAADSLAEAERAA